MSYSDFRPRLLSEVCSNISSRPIVLVAAGASGAILATCALLSYCAAGSPRWKGAPALVESYDFRRCRGRRFGKAARPQPNEPAATLTMMPSGTNVTDPSASTAPLVTLLPSAAEVEDAESVSIADCCGRSNCTLSSERELSNSLSSRVTQDSFGDRATIGQNTPSVYLSRHSSLGWTSVDALSELSTDAMDDDAVGFHAALRAVGPDLTLPQELNIEASCAGQRRTSASMTRRTTDTAVDVDVSAPEVPFMAVATLNAAATLSSREICDDYVRHYADALASRSLPLTHDDAEGPTHTVDTHPLPLPCASPRHLSPTRKDKFPAEAIVPPLRASISHSPPLQLKESPVSTPASVFLWEDQNTSGHGSTPGPLSTLGHSPTGMTGVNVCEGNESLAPLPPPTQNSALPLQGVMGHSGECRIGAFLGGGWCGKVYEYLNTETGEIFAVKELIFEDTDPKLRQRLQELRMEKEVLTLAAQHAMPWIVRFYGAEKRGHCVLMILEYCARGSLLDYVMSYGVPPSAPPPSCASAVSVTSHLATQAAYVSPPAIASRSASEESISFPGAADRLLRAAPLSPPLSPRPCTHCGVPGMPVLPLDEVRRFTQQILEALHFMHSNGYVHLDVKTANILVTARSEARLADFGCSMRLNRSEVPAVPYAVLDDVEEVVEMRGTAQYMAPEIIRFERKRIGTPADVWSLGCVVMEVVTGAAPWSHVADGKMRLLYRVASAHEDLPLPPGIVQVAAKAKQKMTKYHARREGMGTTAKRERDASWNLEDLCVWGRVSERYKRLVNFVALEEFLTACLHIHPEERYSCEELLRHPFLNNYT